MYLVLPLEIIFNQCFMIACCELQNVYKILQIIIILYASVALLKLE